MVENENQPEDEKEESIANEQKEDYSVVTSTTINEYFTESKLARDKMYSQMLESYQRILESTNISDTQKQIASQEISNINNKKNAIMISENLIKNKGIEDAVIFINDKSVSTIVKADKLTEEQIAQVQNIITRELNTDIDNINISTKN